jgi:MFS family permease
VKSPRSSPARGDRVVLITLALVAGATAMVASLGAPLIPAVASEFGVAYQEAQWSLTASLLTGAVAMPVWGRFGSGTSRKPAVILGLSLVAVGCALSALSSRFEWFILGRCLQGVGLALAPLAIAAARDHFEGPRRVSAISIVSVATVAGAGFGYPASSVAAAFWGVQSPYLVAAVMTGGLLLLILCWFPVSTSRQTGSLDPLGVLLLGGGVTALLIGLTGAPRWGWSSPNTAWTLLLGIGLSVSWVGWSLKRRRPLVDVRLAMTPGVAQPIVVCLLAAFGVFAMVSLATLTLQDPEWGLDQSVALAGFLQTPYSLTSVLASRVALAIGSHIGMQWLLPIGCGVLATQACMLAFWHNSLVAVALCMAVGGIGGGFTLATIPLLILPNVPASETASMLAFTQILRCVGSSAGSALSITAFVLLGGDESGLAATAGGLGCIWVLIAVALAALTRGGPGAGSAARA